MRCDRARAVASARADDEAVARDLALLDEHLASCPGCRAFVATTEQVRVALALGRIDAAPDVTAAVLARTTTGRRVRSVRPRRRAPLAVAALFLVVASVAGAFWLGRGTQPETVLDTRGGLPPGDAPAPAARTWTGPRAVVWSRDHLGPDVVRAVEALPAVERTTVVARGTVGLATSRAADGAVVDDPGAGWEIPLDVIGIEPETYGPLLGGPDATVLRRLGPGRAVLGASSARLRGLGVGSRLDVAGRELVVEAVVSDRAVGAAEVAVDRDTGAGLGLTVDRYAVVAYRGPADELVAEVSAAVEVPTRVRDEADTPFLRNGDAVLPQIQVKERFGEFATRTGGEDVEVDPRWFGSEIQRDVLPLVGSITCHRRVLPALRAVLDDLVAEGLGALLTPERLQGCWTPKEVRATGDLSHHTWGAAVDLAPIVVDGARTQDPRLVAAFERHGFTWGGTWLVPDPEHFELLEEPA